MDKIEYTIIKRPKRKNIGINVSLDNRVTVVVPEHVTKKRIRELVDKKSGWIRKKLDFNLNVRQRYTPKEYIDGEEFSYLGKNYRLKVLNGRSGDVVLKNRTLKLHVPGNLGVDEKCGHIASLLTRWYKETALNHLKERVKHYAERISVEPKIIRVKTLKSRWGSCSQEGNLNFNWKIIMAPADVVDYVVVHEVSHLVHHNHSTDFWNHLAAIIPDYKRRKEWLKIHSGLLLA